jgi:myo-inositol-1-phosphate synthase
MGLHCRRCFHTSAIKIAIIGVGNCASSLIQGIEWYRSTGDKEAVGLMHYDLGGYDPRDIEVVAAFDIDARKVGKPVGEAIFSHPNCNRFISDVTDNGVKVSMGKMLDGISPHMKNYPEDQTFVPANEEPCNVVKHLEDSGAEVVLNYLPVGSEHAVRYYSECCLEAGVGLINCMPVFIASDPKWAERFLDAGVPIIGDDVKSQVGATIVHRALTRLFAERGVKLNRTYQLNVGGNTDFLNMLNADRLLSKKISKTESVQSQLKSPLPSESIHIGPSDYIPWLNDNKICFLRMEGTGFAGIPLNLELRLSVEDSPNSAGVAIDAIRCCKLAVDRGIGGPLISISAYTMKHPPEQFPDEHARAMVEEFIVSKRDR